MKYFVVKYQIYPASAPRRPYSEILYPDVNKEQKADMPIITGIERVLSPMEEDDFFSRQLRDYIIYEGKNKLYGFCPEETE